VLMRTQGLRTEARAPSCSGVARVPAHWGKKYSCAFPSTNYRVWSEI